MFLRHMLIEEFSLTDKADLTTIEICVIVTCDHTTILITAPGFFRNANARSQLAYVPRSVAE